MKFEETEMYKLSKGIENYFTNILELYEFVKTKNFTISLGNDEYSRITESLDNVDRAYNVAVRIVNSPITETEILYTILRTLNHSLETIKMEIEELGV